MSDVPAIDRLPELEEHARQCDAQEPGLLVWEIREIKRLRAAVKRLTAALDTISLAKARTGNDDLLRGSWLQINALRQQPERNRHD